MTRTVNGKGEGEKTEDFGFRLARLTLFNFRNYESLEWELGMGFNVLFGRNAQGKTNALEAVYFLSTTRLLRGVKDSEAIRSGENQSKVIGELASHGTLLSILLESGVRKRVQVNGMNLMRACDLLGRLPSVCLSSADAPIVSGEPADRREFLDFELSQLYPAYLHSFAVYKRALEQRNALLRRAQEDYVPDDLFEVWEAEMGKHGSTIRSYRRRLLESLSPVTHEVQGRMGSGEGIELKYLERDDGSEYSNRARDVARGTTQVGPHRDDFQILVEGKEARLFASQGQRRTAMIAIKLGLSRVAEDILGAAPVLLLDDIFSDLDPQRRYNLMELVSEHRGQAILTCTDVHQADELSPAPTLFEVSAGRLTTR